MNWLKFKEAVREKLAPDPGGQPTAGALRSFERGAVLVVKAFFLVIIGYFLFFSNLLADHFPARADGFREAPMDVTWQFAVRAVQVIYVAYVAANVGTAMLLFGARHLKPGGQQALIFGVALLDAAFLGAMVAITGGMDSILYWLYAVLIVRNCLSVSAAVPQFSLNLFTILAYAAGSVVEAMIKRLDSTSAPAGAEVILDPFAEAAGLGWPFYLRLLLLAAAALWCYGLQTLLLRQRRAAEEQRELAVRREQLAASGRLAAEIAHQLKNPLAIINTASYTLQKTVKEGKTITQQIQIIREEVEKSDRLITELMGYSQLVEGRVEKLDLKEELETAIARVFPRALKFEVEIHRDYAIGLPELLAQRNHLQDVFGNILQNARDVMQGRGQISITTRQGDNFSVLVTFEDNGPGIPPELHERVFEPYFTTRDKGTGLGLAIVKHNVEMYGGRVWLESTLGRGTRIVLQFPARSMMRLRK